MSDKDEINEKILDEIESLKVNDKMKEFLSGILLLELDIMDEGRPVFKEKYEKMLNDIFF